MPKHQNANPDRTGAAGFFRRRIMAAQEGEIVFVLGLILALVGYFLLIPPLETVGIILLVLGAVLWVLGAAGHPVGGRRYWY